MVKIEVLMVEAQTIRDKVITQTSKFPAGAALLTTEWINYQPISQEESLSGAFSSEDLHE